MITIFPIIAFVILVFLFILLSRRPYAVIPKVLYGKRVRWTVIGYVVALLVITGVFYVFPKTNSFGVIAEEDDIKTWEISDNLYEAASAGNIPEEYEQYIEQREEVEISDESLNVNYVNGESLSIFIKEKDTNDDLVDVTLYRTPTTVGDVVIDDEIPSVQMETGSNELTFSAPEYPEVKLISYQKEFPIIQFTDENSWMNEDTQMGSNLVYMEVPENIKLDYPEYMDVTYVTE